MTEDQIHVVRAGKQDYLESWRLQQRLAAARRDGRVPDLLLLTEHPPDVHDWPTRAHVTIC